MPASAPASFPPSKFSFAAQPQKWSSRYMHSRRPVAFSRRNFFDLRNLHPARVNTIFYGWAGDLSLDQTCMITFNPHRHILSSALSVLFLIECLFCCTGTEESSPLLQGTTQIRSVSFFIVLPKRWTADVVNLTLNNMNINISLGHLQVYPWYRCHIITFKSLALSSLFLYYIYMYPWCRWNTAFQYHPWVHSEPRKSTRFTTNNIIEHDSMALRWPRSMKIAVRQEYICPQGYTPNDVVASILNRTSHKPWRVAGREGS